MNIIRHRRNEIKELIDTPSTLGIEVDIRSQGERLITHHDPFEQGVDFLEWLSHYQHGTLILNVKEEGLERRLIEVMAQHDLTDYFFLDQSFPFLVKTANEGEPRCAVRVSEFESVETALSLAGKIEWVWVDCFTRFPLDTGQARALQNADFKLCVVSPELQGRRDPNEVTQLRAHLDKLSIQAQAVCTKTPELWST